MTKNSYLVRFGFGHGKILVLRSERKRKRKGKRKRTSYGGLELSIVRAASLRHDKRAVAASRGGPRSLAHRTWKSFSRYFSVTAEAGTEGTIAGAPSVVRPGTGTAATTAAVPRRNKSSPVDTGRDHDGNMIRPVIKGFCYKLKQIRRVIIINPRSRVNNSRSTPRPVPALLHPDKRDRYSPASRRRRLIDMKTDTANLCYFVICLCFNSI